jgi:hypothetical protein
VVIRMRGAHRPQVSHESRTAYAARIEHRRGQPRYGSISHPCAG